MTEEWIEEKIALAKRAKMVSLPAKDMIEILELALIGLTLSVDTWGEDAR